METVSVGQRVLAKVVQKLGGFDVAASLLKIHPSLLRRFIDGKTPVPDVILLRAVDFVLEDLPGLVRPPAHPDETAVKPLSDA